MTTSTRSRLLRYKLKGKTLWLFGMEHVRQVSDPRFELLKDMMSQFCSQHNSQSIVAAEGSVPQENLPLARMIKKYREMGYLKYMSHKTDRSIRSVETTERKIIRSTLATKKYPTEHIMTWLVLNSLEWIMTDDSSRIKKQFRLAINTRLGYCGAPGRSWKSLNDEELIFRADRIVSLRLGRGILLKNSHLDRSYIHKLGDPFGKGYFSRIGRMANLQRELLLATNIYTLLSKRSCFVVIGYNHLKTIDRELRAKGARLQKGRA